MLVEYHASMIFGVCKPLLIRQYKYVPLGYAIADIRLASCNVMNVMIEYHSSRISCYHDIRDRVHPLFDTPIQMVISLDTSLPLCRIIPCWIYIGVATIDTTLILAFQYHPSYWCFNYGRNTPWRLSGYDFMTAIVEYHAYI